MTLEELDMLITAAHNAANAAATLRINQVQMAGELSQLGHPWPKDALDRCEKAWFDCQRTNPILGKFLPPGPIADRDRPMIEESRGEKFPHQFHRPEALGHAAQELATLMKHGLPKGSTVHGWAIESHPDCDGPNLYLVLKYRRPATDTEMEGILLNRRLGATP
jgi:hypothetical protein